MAVKLTKDQIEGMREAHQDKFWDDMSGARAKVTILAREYNVPRQAIEDALNTMMNTLDGYVGEAFVPEPGEE